MAKIETITFACGENEVVRMPENYTQVTGIYTAKMAPQFLTGADNVPFSALQLSEAERAYTERQDLRFFSIR